MPAQYAIRPMPSNRPFVPAPTAIRLPRPAAIADAARALRRGLLVAFPTETVYGLGADATNAEAVAAIYALKRRPKRNPLICHLASVAAARRLGHFDARAELLARAFWPGPMTLVLPRRRDCRAVAQVSAGRANIALRVPSHPVALALLRALRRPLAAPSANPSGQVSPTTARHVAADLGNGVAMVLDGGRCAVGVESTVIDLTGGRARLLRPGGVARGDIEALIGPLRGPRRGRIDSPGMLASHYAPKLPVRLGVRAPKGREALLAFGGPVPKGFARVRNLSPGGDLRQAARRLFACLRALDDPQWRRIAVMPIPDEGIGAAINDRLRRAAASRRRPPPATRHGRETAA
jgi:L-threonylcarbamoyladenylate synthase